jgi:hypothetical protein
VAVLGSLAIITLPVGLAGERENFQQKVREAKTPADHQALAAFYATEAQTARQDSVQHLAMRDAYAAIPVLREKGKADAHCEAIAKRYQRIATEYEALVSSSTICATWWIPK